VQICKKFHLHAQFLAWNSGAPGLYSPCPPHCYATVRPTTRRDAAFLPRRRPRTPTPIRHRLPVLPVLRTTPRRPETGDAREAHTCSKWLSREQQRDLTNSSPYGVQRRRSRDECKRSRRRVARAVVTRDPGTCRGPRGGPAPARGESPPPWRRRWCRQIGKHGDRTDDGHDTR